MTTDDWAIIISSIAGLISLASAFFAYQSKNEAKRANDREDEKFSQQKQKESPKIESCGTYIVNNGLGKAKCIKIKMTCEQTLGGEPIVKKEELDSLDPEARWYPGSDTSYSSVIIEILSYSDIYGKIIS